MGEYWELKKTFAALKVLREQQGLSISDMADRTGMDRAMISRLENGQLGNPTLATVGRYAQALGKRVARFQKSDRRIRLFKKLREYVRALRKASCGTSLVINGSFVMA